MGHFDFAVQIKNIGQMYYTTRSLFLNDNQMLTIENFRSPTKVLKVRKIFSENRKK